MVYKFRKKYTPTQNFSSNSIRGGGTTTQHFTRHLYKFCLIILNGHLPMAQYRKDRAFTVCQTAWNTNLWDTARFDLPLRAVSWRWVWSKRTRTACSLEGLAERVNVMHVCYQTSQCSIALFLTYLKWFTGFRTEAARQNLIISFSFKERSLHRVNKVLWQINISVRRESCPASRRWALRPATWTTVL